MQRGDCTSGRVAPVGGVQQAGGEGSVCDVSEEAQCVRCIGVAISATAEDMPQAACELTVDLREGGHEVALYRSLIMLSRSNGSLVALLEDLSMTRAIVGGCGRRMALARLQLRLSQALAGHRVTLGQPHSGPGWLSPMGLGCALSLVAPTRLQIVVDKQVATEAMCEAGPKATATAVPKHERAATHACWSQHAAAQSQHMDRRIGMIVQVK
eukprot:CAMPEP_0181221732 /NCGR_PEP_ID=MMETSP1096-20121128/29572_1 /TAXON_ID=156174 ORGANISM="Chrysochromulina ericina, Strain CCMP281" /NCGR_SAMPLE_ID=MMETSP1096 /ASSEMBLY_ACC=CAM_ASM_000453 /LENGTH=211 /DNA_ID=CAMNT_0023314411 /DNA_START=128 /DNA_END=760 /DNA_ORIENTATION=+